ncbi:MAG: translation initiation factor Sui1 [Deltaproteobacteria bacterium]|nr:translation initiation factor Sui1 [Deltaproteobacteria bacterium]
MSPPKSGSGPRTVYSSALGRLCPDCGQPRNQCRCPSPQDRVVGDGKVRVRRETKGRKGKTVTTVSGIPLAESELKALGKELKQLCGSGGAVKDGIIEVQGDHCDSLLKALLERGYAAKRAGG